MCLGLVCTSAGQGSLLLCGRLVVQSPVLRGSCGAPDSASCLMQIIGFFAKHLLDFNNVTQLESTLLDFGVYPP